MPRLSAPGTGSGRRNGNAGLDGSAFRIAPRFPPPSSTGTSKPLPGAPPRVSPEGYLGPRLLSGRSGLPIVSVVPLKQSRCFVLRTYPVRETDKIAVLFSGEEGKVRGWARGARRPRSRFGSSLDTGNEVEVGWFEREGRELVHVDRCDLVASALPLVRDPVRAAALRYLSELVDIFAPGREANPKLYRLIAACRDALLRERPAALVVAYFEAWLLRLSGLYPRPGRCGCGAGFERDGALFFAAGPAFRCSRCAAGRGEPTARLSGDALGLLEEFWTAAPGAAFRELSAAAELFRFHGRLAAASAEKTLRTRAALEGMLGAAVE